MAKVEVALEELIVPRSKQYEAAILDEKEVVLKKEKDGRVWRGPGKAEEAKYERMDWGNREMPDPHRRPGDHAGPPGWIMRDGQAVQQIEHELAARRDLQQHGQFVVVGAKVAHPNDQLDLAKRSGAKQHDALQVVG